MADEPMLRWMNTEMAEEIKIGRRFSMVIPKRIRKKIKVREGQTAIIAAEGERIIVQPLPEDPYQVLAETLGDFNYSEERHEKRAEEWLRRLARPRHGSSIRSEP
jgi:AbrB family looped-hinge helix DNA binding protein